MYKKIEGKVKSAFDGGLGHILSANLLVTVFSFGSQFFVANWLGPVDLGVIKIMQSIFGIAIIFVNFGLTTVLLKEIPLYTENHQKRGLFSFAWRTNIWLFLTVFIVIYICNSLKILPIPENTTFFFFIYILGLLPLAFNSNSGVYLQSLRLFKLNSRILLYSKACGIILVILLTYLYGINGFITGTVIGYFLTSVFYISNREISIKKHDYKQFNTRENRLNAFYSMMTFLTGKGSMLLDILIIQFFVTNEFEIGLFGFAMTLMAGLSIISESLQQYFTPQITSSVKNPALFRITLRTKKLTFFLISIVVGILVFFLVPILTNTFFKEFVGAVPIFDVLILSWIFKNSFAMNNTGLVALNRIDLCFKQNIISSVISVIGVSVFTFQFGIIGGAIGRSVTSFLALLLSGILIKNQIEKIEQN